MFDLTHQAYAHCLTAEKWSMEVKSSDGKRTYVVRWDNHSHKNHSVQYDYSCDCVAYKMGKGKYCKHIEEAKQHHCNWMQFTDGGETRDGKCPECGGEVSSRNWGV